MPTINTATGTCAPKDLGFTLIHEHITAGFPGWELDNAGFDCTSRLWSADRSRVTGRFRFHPSGKQPEQIREAIQVNDDFGVL